MYFHSEEQSEAGMRVQSVQFLFQLTQPLRRQMHILQQYPTTALIRAVDHLVRLTEAWNNTCFTLLFSYIKKPFRGRQKNIGDRCADECYSMEK